MNRTKQTKQTKRDRDWFRGLKWAEEVVKAGHRETVELATYPPDDAFDLGARDYLIHENRINEVTP